MLNKSTTAIALHAQNVTLFGKGCYRLLKMVGPLVFFGNQISDVTARGSLAPKHAFLLIATSGSPQCLLWLLGARGSKEEETSFLKVSWRTASLAFTIIFFFGQKRKW